MADVTSGLDAVKIWILTGCLSATLVVIGYFLKRVLDSIDARSVHIDTRIEKSMDALSEQNARIMQILSQVTFHAERLNSLEQRLDKARCNRQ